jgi:hypothetical protein
MRKPDKKVKKAELEAGFELTSPKIYLEISIQWE